MLKNSSYFVAPTENLDTFEDTVCETSLSRLDKFSLKRLGSVMLWRTFGRIGWRSHRDRYDDCFLRYSNIRFFSSVDTSPGLFMWNINNASDPRSLFAAVYGLMDSLVNEAAGGPGMFATGEVAVNGTGGGQKVYGLAQCTRDLSRDSCAQCLLDANQSMPVCCAGKLGGRVLGQSCNLRFEVYKFYKNYSIASLGLPMPVGGGPPPMTSPTMTNLTGGGAVGGGGVGQVMEVELLVEL
ncbi:Cysteine-rich repeat secretory protein 38 [Acorus calamus]|uniref:Cysteine-rich repeat secretory protein 38 n=1 Tax=Acorus calamus TaxID=4465 RepID=A0AAV9DS83_ACOCL|nr:Cysteine-rich repeat secretory protein 38 [Acorus calamus]